MGNKDVSGWELRMSEKHRARPIEGPPYWGPKPPADDDPVCNEWRLGPQGWVLWGGICNRKCGHGHHDNELLTAAV